MKVNKMIFQELQNQINQVYETKFYGLNFNKERKKKKCENYIFFSF